MQNLEFKYSSSKKTLQKRKKQNRDGNREAGEKLHRKTKGEKLR